MAKKKPTPAKKPAKKKASKLHKMTVVCDDHTDCLAFAKKVKAAAKGVTGASGVKLRKLAEGFIPG